MASFVIATGAPFVPSHWRLAVQHQVWDMTKGPNIAEGDDAYFWALGASLLGRVRVTEATRPIHSGDRLPWEDAKQTNYTKRFRFEVLSDRPTTSRPGASSLLARGSGRSPTPSREWCTRPEKTGSRRNSLDGIHPETGAPPVLTGKVEPPPTDR